MSSDPTAITTEIPVTAMPAMAAVPIAPSTPADRAGASGAATGLEPCPHCGTPLALDQRYCLECGSPRTYLSGMLLAQMQATSAQGSPAQPAPPVSPPQPPLGAAPSQQAWQRGNSLTLIASIGVLLLAMGVGVLIGRSGSSSSSSAPPQVITVPAASSGAASTTTTPATPEESAAAKAAAAATAGAAAKHKAKETGVGATPSKPAPPTVLKNLRTGSGGSYEQKSKNLPNVVSTG